MRPVLGPLLAVALLAGCGGGAEQVRDRVPRRRSVERYVAMLENDERAAWQKPDEVVAVLGLAPGAVVADVGTGSGYFLPQLVAAVGPTGRIVAEDIDPELVEHVRGRATRAGWDVVEARVGEPDDPHLEAGAFDVILAIDVYHHVARPAAFLAAVRRALAAGGRFVVIDFAPGDHVPEGISGRRHRITREQVIADAEAAGMRLVREHDFLQYQFFLELAVDQSAGASSAGSAGGSLDEESPGPPSNADPIPTRSPHTLPSRNEKPNGGSRLSTKPAVRNVVVLSRNSA
jgi:ubiquinone/menaquinone biosynthesis C-methylase UbiE